MSQDNDHDFRDQHKILVLEMLTNPGVEMVTNILLHSVMLLNIDKLHRQKWLRCVLIPVPLHGNQALYHLSYNICDRTEQKQRDRWV